MGPRRALLQWYVTRLNEGKGKAIREQIRHCQSQLSYTKVGAKFLVATWKLDIKSKYLFIPTNC